MHLPQKTVGGYDRCLPQARSAASEPSYACVDPNARPRGGDTG